MQCLERRVAFGVERDDLAVEDRALRRHARGRGGNGRKLAGDVLEISRGQRDEVAALDSLRPIAVPFDLVRPLAAIGQRCGAGRHHRWDRFG